MVLEDVTEFDWSGTATATKKLPKILLNGNNVCMVCVAWVGRSVYEYLVLTSSAAHTRGRGAAG